MNGQVGSRISEQRLAKSGTSMMCILCLNNINAARTVCKLPALDGFGPIWETCAAHSRHCSLMPDPKSVQNSTKLVPGLCF